MNGTHYTHSLVIWNEESIKKKLWILYELITNVNFSIYCYRLPMLWHDFDYPNNKLMPSSCKYAFKLKSVSCARLIPSIRIEAQTSICHPTWVWIRSRNCCFRKPGLVWKKASTLFFFNYTFISAYKIYFLLRIKDTVSDILSVLLNFIAIIMILKMKIFLHTVYKIFNK